MVDVTLNDIGLLKPEYVLNGYYPLACKDCGHYKNGIYSRYDANAAPDGVELDRECNYHRYSVLKIRREYMAAKMTLDEYLGLKGLSFPVSDYMLDKIKFPHGLTERQKRKLMKEASAHEEAYVRKRRAATEDYNKLVADGEIIPKTRLEVTLEKAINGHPDNESTQAARRICEKRGIDWRSMADRGSSV